MSRLSISESCDVYSDCSSMELLFFCSIAILGVVESDGVADSAENFLRLTLSIFLGVILNDPILGLLSFLYMCGDDILDSDSSSIVVVFIVTLFVNLLYYQFLV